MIVWRIKAKLSTQEGPKTIIVEAVDPAGNRSVDPDDGGGWNHHDPLVCPEEAR